MFFLVTKEFSFDAAHRLDNYHGKCENLHGHTWKIRITVKAPLKDTGIAFDFIDLKDIVTDRVIKKLDHTLLNDKIAQPSAEHIALWIQQQLTDIPLYEIVVWETATSFITLKVEGHI